MTTHEQNEHAPKHSHEHHHRSSRRNAFMAALQIPVGLATGSLVCLVAGTHNLVDSKVHRLRHDAACESDRNEKKSKRLKSAVLLAGTALGSYAAEKFIGIKPESTVIISGLFAVETAVNATGVHDDLQQVIDKDTKSSLSHNVIDTAVSGVTTIVTGLPLAITNFKPETFDAIAGYGHLVLISGLALSSTIEAFKDEH